MESFVLFIFFIVLYFTYTRPVLKEKKRLKREAEEEAAMVEKWREEEAKKKIIKINHYKEVLSKISYPDPITSSDEEILIFLEQYYCDGSDIFDAYFDIELKKRNYGGFLKKFFDYHRKKRFAED